MNKVLKTFIVAPVQGRSLAFSVDTSPLCTNMERINILGKVHFRVAFRATLLSCNSSCSRYGVLGMAVTKDRRVGCSKPRWFTACRFWRPGYLRSRWGWAGSFPSLWGRMCSRLLSGVLGMASRLPHVRVPISVSVLRVPYSLCAPVRDLPFMCARRCPNSLLCKFSSPTG